MVGCAGDMAAVTLLSPVDLKSLVIELWSHTVIT